MSNMNLREATPTFSECRTDQSNPEGVQFKLECILGCKIDTSKQVIGLDCFHFVCSDSCVQKLKSSCKSGSQLTCTACSSVIKPEKLKRKLVPDQIFIKKSDFTSTELICENCIHNRPATAFCPQCPSLLCSQCYELHPQTRATKEHKITKDITEQKSKQLAKLLEDETKCSKHKKPLLELCIKCDLKICQNCAASHQGHPTCNIENERQALKSRIESQRKLRETLHQAVREITEKTNEIMTVEWHNITTQINEHFTEMANILVKRRNELEKEAKERVRKQVGALNMRRKCAELSIACSEGFSYVAENVLVHHADTAATKLLRQFGDSVESLDELERTIASKYNQYVDKDWHFGLDLSTTTDAQKYLREYCQVEYSYKPSSSTSSSLTGSNGRNKESVITSRGESSISDLKRSPSRRIAVKSTGGAGLATQLIVNKNQQQPKTYSRLKMSSLQGSSSEKTDLSQTQPVELQDLDTETEGDDDDATEENRNGSAKSKSRKGHNSCQSENIIITDKKRGPTTSVVLTNGSVANEVQQPVITPGTDAIAKSTIRSSSTKTNPSSSPDVCASSLSIAEENSRANAQKSDETVGMPVPIQLDPGSSSSAQDRPEEASPDSHMSSVSESSELGMGKRERKKKEFHDFVDTDKSLKMLRKQNSEAASAARVRQKSASSKSVTPKATRLLQEVQGNEGGDEDAADAPKPMDEEDDVSIDVESRQDCESSDGYSSEGPTLRRQSLRKRTINNPDTPPETSTRKRLRASSLGPNNTIDDSTFQEAPESSFDVRPDPDYDYPVQGQGRMKITNIDENEDYCCICLDGGEEIIICCDFCPKVFHMTCHLPVIENIPEGEEKWRCNYDIPKETIDELVASFPNPDGSEKRELTDSNKHHFLLACKFVMECYKIPEIPTMRWVFPKGYKDKYGKLPFHMKYIREKLCRGIPEPFSGVEDMLLAFRQMFIQAFLFYKRKQQKVRPMAIKCFEKFLELIDEYYPKYRELFKNVLLE